MQLHAKVQQLQLTSENHTCWTRSLVAAATKLDSSSDTHTGRFARNEEVVDITTAELYSIEPRNVAFLAVITIAWQ